MTVLFSVSFQVTHSRAENNVQLYWIKANHTHLCGGEKTFGVVTFSVTWKVYAFYSTARFCQWRLKHQLSFFFGGYVVILLQFRTTYQRLGPMKGRRERGRAVLHPYHLFWPVYHFISPLFPAEPSFFPTLGLWNPHVISFSVLKDAAIHFSYKLEWRS